MREPSAAGGWPDSPCARVAYVLKAYPRSSEPFILSEIHRLEARGLPVRLFALKPAEPDDREPRHAVVDRIRAVPEFLTAAGSVSGVWLPAWLAAHLPRFSGALLRVARRHPGGFARSLVLLVRELRASRRPPRTRIKRAWVREWLQAVDLADRLDATPAVRHLHAHFAHGATSVAWLASAITGVSFSFTGHAKDLYAEDSNPGGALARKLAAAAFAVTCTDANRRLLDGLGTATPVHLVYHGLNDDFSRLLRHAAPPARARRPFRVLAVGRLVRKKGFDVLVEAVARLHRRGVALDVVIAGSRGDAAPAIEAQIRQAGLEAVIRLAGPQDQPTLFDWYHGAHVFCLPCRVLDDGDRDGIPNVLMEAMACGTPVVTTAVSGIPEMVRHEANGLLVPPDDPAALADALERARTDDGLMGAMAAAARATAAEQFDGDHLAGRMVRLFAEAVA